MRRAGAEVMSWTLRDGAGRNQWRFGDWGWVAGLEDCGRNLAGGLDRLDYPALGCSASVVSTGSTTRGPYAQQHTGLDSGPDSRHIGHVCCTRTKGLTDGRQCTGDGTSGRVLRPRQDDHREVEHARLQQAVPGRRPDLAPGGAP